MCATLPSISYSSYSSIPSISRSRASNFNSDNHLQFHFVSHSPNIKKGGWLFLRMGWELIYIIYIGIGEEIVKVVELAIVAFGQSWCEANSYRSQLSESDFRLREAAQTKYSREEKENC